MPVEFRGVALRADVADHEPKPDRSCFMNLERINAWTDDEAHASFLRCCGSRVWSEEMAAARPFQSEAALFEAAARIWWRLSKADWLEAFAAHPRIGDLDAIRAKFATTAAWASREQAGAIGAPRTRSSESSPWETASTKSVSASSSSFAQPARRPRKCSRSWASGSGTIATPSLGWRLASN